MYLSEHFSEAEFLASQTAISHGINNTWTDIEHRNNAIYLCKYYLEPLRVLLGVPIKISSGYRCPALNKLVKGEASSAHKTGEAVDIIVPNMERAFRRIRDWTQAGTLPIPDQIIHYPQREFIHFGISPKPRGQFFVSEGGQYKLIEIISGINA